MPTVELHTNCHDSKQMKPMGIWTAALPEWHLLKTLGTELWYFSLTGQDRNEKIYIANHCITFRFPPCLRKRVLFITKSYKHWFSALLETIVTLCFYWWQSDFTDYLTQWIFSLQMMIMVVPTNNRWNSRIAQEQNYWDKNSSNWLPVPIVVPLKLQGSISIAGPRKA